MYTEYFTFKEVSMSTYTIATIGTKNDQHFFEIAKQTMQEMNFNSKNQINFIDITGKNENEILAIGNIQGIMYFNDIHNIEIDNSPPNNAKVKSENSKNLDTFTYALNLSNKNSDKLNLFTLSRTAITAKDKDKENQILQKYIDTPLKTQSYPVNVSNITDFKNYITGIVGLTAILHLDLANPVNCKVNELVNKMAEISLNRLKIKNKSHAEHEIRVAKLAKAIAIQSKDFTSKEIELLFLSAKLHDIGKIGIPDEILAKPSSLNYIERMQMDYHSTMGASILEIVVANNPKLAETITPDVIKGVAFHHKDYNGLHNINKNPEELTPTDYDPIRGETIGKFASIIAVADCIDAMTAQRAYNNPKHIVDTFRDLYSNKGKQFKPEYAEAGMIVLAKEIAFLGINPILLFDSNSHNYFNHKDFKIRTFLETHKNEFKISKNVSESTFSPLGFRLDEEGYFEFEGKDAPIRNPSIRFNDEFCFQKNKLKKAKEAKHEVLTDEDIENIKKDVIKKFKKQDLEGKQSITRAKIKNSMSLAQQIFQDITQNNITIKEVRESLKILTIARQCELKKQPSPNIGTKGIEARTIL